MFAPLSPAGDSGLHCPHALVLLIWAFAWTPPPYMAILWLSSHVEMSSSWPILHFVSSYELQLSVCKYPGPKLFEIDAPGQQLEWRSDSRILYFPFLPFFLTCVSIGSLAVLILSPNRCVWIVVILLSWHRPQRWPTDGAEILLLCWVVRTDPETPDSLSMLAVTNE